LSDTPKHDLRALLARWWPSALSVALFAAMVFVVARIGFARAGGQLGYALDDAYIHMALAKNLAVHGVFGATPYGFTSASSSTLWTLIEAGAFRVFGVLDAIPLVLTCLISVALLIVTDAVLVRFGVRSVVRFLALLWVVFAAPLAPIVFGGMEHPLQILLDVSFVAVAAILLQRDQPRWDRLAVLGLVLAALTGWVRYEGILLVAIVAAAFALRRRFGYGAAVLVSGVLPAIVFGVVSVSLGGFFLPNPVLVKGTTSAGIGLLLNSPAAYGAAFVARFSTAYPLYLLLIASALLLVLQRMRGRSLWEPTVSFPLVAVIVSAVHLTVGDVGWFFRYEDYMVVLLGLGLVLQLCDVLPLMRQRGAIQSAVLVLALVFATGAGLACANRGNVALRSTPWAIKNVHDEQYLIAHFLKANPRYDHVAIGDLGAISYYNDALHILDLEGLAENGVPLAELGRARLTAEMIRKRAKERGSQIAIVFPDYFDLPPEWVRVGEWTISTNIVNYGPTVDFYAIPPTDPSALGTALEGFAASGLPKDVSVRVVP
jgi:hypothetical protein